MIAAIKHNLNRGVRLLTKISDSQYSDASIEPYHSSIGTHMRHVLDMFDCVFCGIECDAIDLTARKRNQLAEEKTVFGLAYFEEIIHRLDDLEVSTLNRQIKVTDDLGLGCVTVDYTLIGILIQAHSHAIHHFASVGYIITQLGIELPDADFGFNPSTPKKVTTV